MAREPNCSACRAATVGPVVSAGRSDGQVGGENLKRAVRQGGDLFAAVAVARRVAEIIPRAEAVSGQIIWTLSGPTAMLPPAFNPPGNLFSGERQ